MPASLERVLAEVAAESLCRSSFAEFLTWCKIQSEDSSKPGLIQLNPFPFQIERAEAWQTGRSEVILKERQQGFSAALVAPYMLWRAMYSGWTCGYLSVGQKEAREEITRISTLYANLPTFLKVLGTVRVDDAEFEGGGRIIAFPSTEHAGISFTLHLGVMDELAFHPYGAPNYAAIQPAIGDRQFIGLSTADPTLGPSGFFHDLYWNSKRGETGYTAVFEARRRPDRDAEWYVQAKRRYAGRPEEFDAYYPESDAAAFVGRSGLVYLIFDPQRHTPLNHPWQWESSIRKVAGVDFGGGDPTAVVPMGLSGKHHVHQFGEFYQRGPVSVYDIANYLGRWKGPGIAVCDPSEPVAIETLDVALRGSGWTAQAADNRRGEGLGFVGELLAEDRLTIAASCKESILEFAGYRWAERTDPSDRTRYATKTVVDHHADAMDARRYAVMELLWMLRQQNRLPLKDALSGRKLETVVR